ncbi:MAG: hypothetical protein ILO53_01085 [Clostridia bacterium]|nr:hypothetical protein [Clostridia bacterium]
MRSIARKNIVVLFIVLLASALIFGCDILGTEIDNQKKVEDTPESQRYDLKVGESVTIKGVTLTVNSISDSTTNSGLPAYEVSVTYTNHSGSTITATPYDWKTVLQTGTEKAHVGGDVSFHSKSIKNGEEWSGIITLWKDSNSEKVKFESSLLNFLEDQKAYATWLISENKNDNDDNSSADNQNDTVADISITVGEEGEFGRFVTFNADTEMPETKLVYFIPVGKYVVQYLGTKTIQLTVYSEEVQMTEEGWEEPRNTYDNVLLKAGESGILEVVEGSYVEINGSGTIDFRKQ